MTDSAPQDANAALRRAVFGILIAVAVGNMAGRILAVNSVNVAKLEKYRIDQRLNETRQKLVDQGVEGDALDSRLKKRRAELAEKLPMQRPFLSSNDRSRWATVRSLVELGTYEIDAIVAQPMWDTIDMVSHPDREGDDRLYSSKPPLLATLLAGEYWAIHKLTGGKTLRTHPYEIGRFLLLSINIPLFVVMLILLVQLVERFGQTDFGRFFVITVAALGTLLSSFAIVLNNHLFAVTSVTIALYVTVRVVCDGELRGRYFILAGLSSAFAVACELPALSLLALVSVVLLWNAPRQTILWFVPAVLLVAVAFFGTNYAAHDTLSPPYAHRHAENPDDNWYHYTFVRNGRERDSYWKNPQGIDRGEPDRGVYALHVLVGHHGIFSLTPVWLLSAIGTGIWLVGGMRKGPFEASGRRKPTESKETGDRRNNPKSEIRNPKFLLALATLFLTTVCLVFFILLRPQEDRNYGGMTNGFRWLFWLAPFWLVTLLPAADWAGCRRWTRRLATVFLALSVLSSAYATWNPWSQPWIARFFEYLGWVKFG